MANISARSNSGARYEPAGRQIPRRDTILSARMREVGAPKDEMGAINAPTTTTATTSTTNNFDEHVALRRRRRRLPVKQKQNNANKGNTGVT